MIPAIILSFVLAILNRLARKRTRTGRWVHVRHLSPLTAKPGRFFTKTKI